MAFFAWLTGKKNGNGRHGPCPAAGGEGSLIDLVLREDMRRERVRRARSLLSDLAPDQASDLVDGVARHFLAYALDIPAAENYHHARPFGLFDHSLDVAEIALRGALTQYFVSDTRAYPEDQVYLLPRLRYAAWFFGLLHDAGKIVQVEIRAPDGTRWNPFEEPLLDFYRRHGRERCTFAWLKGRGLDAHVWHGAYLMGRLLLPPVAAYIGPRLVSEILSQGSIPAKEVLHLVTAADHRSTGADVDRQAEEAHAARAEGRPPEILVAVGDYLEKFLAAFARAIARRALRLNALDGEVLVGRRWFLLRYPEALAKLVPFLQEEAGRESAAARALRPDAEGARALAQALHGKRALFYDPETDAWKVKAKVDLAGAFAVLSAVLVDRAFLESALAPFGKILDFSGGLTLVRANDEKPIPVEGFAAGGPSEGVIVPMPPPGPPVPDLHPSPVPALRKFISPEVLFEDIRRALLDGTIESNQWNRRCYILPDATYLASPRGFQILVDKGLYDRDPKREVNVYLDALAKIPCVRKHAGGKVLTAIAVRPGARHLWVVAFDTRGLFKDQAELARVGLWTESPIRELSEDEIRAQGAIVAAPPPPAPEAAHA